MTHTAKTERAQLAFFEETYGKFLSAAARVGHVDYCYSLAGTTVRLRFAGDALVSQLTPALEHLRISPVSSPDFTVCLWDSESTGIAMVPPPCGRQSFCGRGDIWGFNSRRVKTAFQDSSVYVLDHEVAIGVCWTGASRALPYWVTASPLRTLFHWWMEKNDCQLVHGAAVGTQEAAVLIVGAGGLGKSTLALTCLQAGLRFLGDDYVVARRRPQLRVYSIYSTAKLDAAQLERFPAMTRFVSTREYLREEKAVLFLYPEFGEQIVAELPIKAILTPHIADREDTEVRPEEASVVRRAASFTTISQLPYASRHTEEFFADLSKGAPGYTLLLGRDLAHIPRAVAQFLHDDLRPPGTTIALAGDPVTRPLISVIIPILNGERFVGQAVESIIGQGYPSTEIIIVDDGSTDRTEAVAKALPYPVRYFKQANAGPAAARNRGIQAANGDLLAFLDVDDTWPEDTLNLLVDELLRDPSLDLVHGYAQNLECDPVTGEYEYRGSPTDSFPYSIAAALYRRRAFERVGLFDATLLYGEDMDWFRRAHELNIAMKRVTHTTLMVRMHDRNMTRERNLMEVHLLKVLRRAIQRKRASAAAP